MGAVSALFVVYFCHYSVGGIICRASVAINRWQGAGHNIAFVLFLVVLFLDLILVCFVLVSLYVLSSLSCSCSGCSVLVLVSCFCSCFSVLVLGVLLLFVSLSSCLRCLILFC
jgi:hypothetical protein